MAPGSTSVIEPKTILRHAAAIFSPMAMLAGMQLNLFTALKDGPRTAAEIAGAAGVSAGKLGPLPTHWSSGKAYRRLPRAFLGTRLGGVGGSRSATQQGGMVRIYARL